MGIPETLRHGSTRVSAAIADHPTVTRWLLAGPGALLASLATLLALPIWLPSGPAGVNNIALPIVLLPLLWAGPFFYACIEENLVRGTAILTGAIIVQGAAAALVA